MAEAPAPARSRPVAIGAPCVMTARPPAAPCSESAPSWAMMLPTWIEMTMPNGIAMRMPGKLVTPIMYQTWFSASFHWSRPRIVSVTSATRDMISIRTLRPIVRIESTTVLEKFLLMMDQ